MLARCLILIFQARGSCCCAAGLGTDAARGKARVEGARLLCLPALDEPTHNSSIAGVDCVKTGKKGKSRPCNADEWKSEEVKRAGGNV